MSYLYYFVYMSILSRIFKGAALVGSVCAGALVAEMTHSSIASLPRLEAITELKVEAALSSDEPPEEADIAAGNIEFEWPNRPEPVIVHGGTSHRLIHFTFDDGPNRATTPELLEVLDRYGVKATFFVTTERLRELGNRARDERELLTEIAQRGHAIANHTVRHRQLTLLGAAEMRAEVDEASAVIEELTGTWPTLFRPPGGARSNRTDALVASWGYSQVLWNLGTGDSQVDSAEHVLTTFERVLARRESEHGEQGGIVLLHDIHAWSVEATELMLQRLMARNCELLAEGEELYDVVDSLAPFFAAEEMPAEQVFEHLRSPATLASATPDASTIRRRQARLRRQAETRCTAVASLQGDAEPIMKR